MSYHDFTALAESLQASMDTSQARLDALLGLDNGFDFTHLLRGSTALNHVGGGISVMPQGMADKALPTPVIEPANFPDGHPGHEPVLVSDPLTPVLTDPLPSDPIKLPTADPANFPKDHPGHEPVPGGDPVKPVLSDPVSSDPLKLPTADPANFPKDHPGHEPVPGGDPVKPVLSDPVSSDPLKLPTADPVRLSDPVGDTDADTIHFTKEVVNGTLAEAHKVLGADLTMVGVAHVADMFSGESQGNILLPHGVDGHHVVVPADGDDFRFM